MEMPTSAAAKKAANNATFTRIEELSAEVRRPLPGSQKVYVTGSRPDLRVPMRVIRQSPTTGSFGDEPNPPFPVYDTSGPYTDPDAEIDLLRGLPSVRGRWIEERGDTEQLTDLSSQFGRERAADAKTEHLRFEHVHKPRRAKAGRCVTQLHYAKQGIVTPEMEYVAIREAQNLEQLRETDPKLFQQHAGQPFPLEAVEKTMRERGRSLGFADEEIDGLLETSYGDKRLIPLLSLLFPEIDLKNHLHVDHIYPRSRLSRSKLSKSKLTREQTADLHDRRDELPQPAVPPRH